jgi:hypothetical protein
MKIFISWSKDRSRAVAQALHDWLPDVLRGVDPFFSGQDIAAGTKWYERIVDELDASSIGIVCLTSENAREPWPVYEAGRLRGKLITVLIGIGPSEMPDPLRAFQHVTATRQGIQQLVESINKDVKDGLPPDRLVKAFDKWWPDIERHLPGSPSATPSMPGSTTPLEAAMKVMQKLPSTYGVRCLRCSLTLHDDDRPALLTRAYEGLFVEQATVDLPIKVKMAVDRGTLSDLRFLQLAPITRKLSWQPVPSADDQNQRVAGTVVVSDVFTPKSGELGFVVSVNLAGGFCRTETEAREYYRNALYKKEYNGVLVVIPAETLEITVNFPRSSVGRVHSIAPVAFYGASEEQNLSEYERIEPGLTVDAVSGQAVLKIKEPLRGQVYGISWMPPND